MNILRITDEMAHELAMLAAHKAAEQGLGAGRIAQEYRRAFKECNEEPEVTGSMSIGHSPPKEPGIQMDDPLHADYDKNFVRNKDR